MTRPTLSADMTLRAFFESYYLPVCVTPDASKSYLTYLRIAIKKWVELTGNPPLREIDALTVAGFRDALGKLPGRYGGPPASETVAHKLHVIHRVLRKCGPPGYRNDDAAGLLERVPWARPPRPIQKFPQTVPLDVLGKVYEAADTMKWPRIPGVDPGMWWRCLLTVVYNTGLRYRTVFELEWADVDWTRKCFILPGERIKSRRPLVVPLNKITLEHLRTIQGDRKRIFGFEQDPSWFRQHLHRLQWRAGYPWEEHFTLQTLRRTLATQLWAISPGAAQLALGHAAMQITRDCYVNPDNIVRSAMDNLIQPAAFRRPPNGSKTGATSPRSWAP